MARRPGPGRRSDGIWHWATSWLLHAGAVGAFGLAAGETPPQDPSRELWADPVSDDDLSRPEVVAPGTALYACRGYEDAISDIPLGGSGVSGALGAGGGGMAGLFGSGPTIRRPIRPEPRRLATTEEAGLAAAAWLVRRQEPDGRWSPEGGASAGARCAAVPATALALLALSASGAPDRSEGGRAGLLRGLAWLVSQQREDGAVFGRGPHRSDPAWAEYGHTLAALALLEGAERCGGGPAAGGAAWRALQFSLARHSPGVPGWEGGGAESVADHAGWHLTLLRRAREAGHYLPDGTARRAGLALATMRRLEAAPAGEAGRRAAWRGARVMEILAAAKQPDLSGTELGLPPPADPRWPERDLRAWRWSAATARLGGGEWQVWAGKTGTLLVNRQGLGGELDGSWDAPVGGPAAGPYRGRAVATALGALILADCRRRTEP